MNAKHLTILLSLLLASGAFARDSGGEAPPACPPGGGPGMHHPRGGGRHGHHRGKPEDRGPCRGPEGREAARECFELARRIRESTDEAEKAALTEELRGKVAERRAARIEADKRRIETAERDIAERHEAALRALENIRQRVAEAEAHQAEDTEKEMEALLGGEEGFPPRGPGGHFGFGRRERRDGRGEHGHMPPPHGGPDREGPPPEEPPDDGNPPEEADFPGLDG